MCYNTNNSIYQFLLIIRVINFYSRDSRDKVTGHKPHTSHLGLQKNMKIKGVISKWHFKINQFNAKTVEPSLLGQQKSKNSIKKRVSTHHFAVKIVVQKHAQTSTMVEEAAEATGVQDNLSQ